MITGKRIKNAINRKFPVIAVDDSLEAAMQMMSKANVSVLAVKIGEELVGILTVSDVNSALADDKDPRETKISSFMTKCEFHTKNSTRNSCLQLDEDEDVISAIKVMNEAGVNHLLVTGENAKPVGIVSSLELIKLVSSPSG
jgi:predicted transcriptional regulator